MKGDTLLLGGAASKLICTGYIPVATPSGIGACRASGNSLPVVNLLILLNINSISYYWD